MKLGRAIIQRSDNYFNYRFVPHAIILMYHRVADMPFDPQLLSVTPQHFNEQLEIICKFAHPMSLKELAWAVQKDKIPNHGVIVTFDDGYADNLQNAKPLLERHDVPATIFITAGHVGCQDEFWWDELEQIFLLPGELPFMLHLNINGNDQAWDIHKAAEYSAEDYLRYRNWHIELPDDPTARHKLYRSIYQLLHSLQETERQRIMQELRTLAHQEIRGRQSHRSLTNDEVSLLVKGDLIEVGAHTMTHATLAKLSVAAQREEIIDSKTYLEEMLNRTVTSFAYPHGSYTGETVSLIKEAGFTSACSSDTSLVARGMDVFCLPRFSMRDWNGDEFYRWLKGLMNIW